MATIGRLSQQSREVTLFAFNTIWQMALVRLMRQQLKPMVATTKWLSIPKVVDVSGQYRAKMIRIRLHLSQAQSTVLREALLPMEFHCGNAIDETDH